MENKTQELGPTEPLEQIENLSINADPNIKALNNSNEKEGRNDAIMVEHGDPQIVEKYLENQSCESVNENKAISRQTNNESDITK